MLSKDDRQRLESIEYALRKEDPMFAAAMQKQSWRLVPHRQDRRPGRTRILVVLALVAFALTVAVVTVAGLLA